MKFLFDGDVFSFEALRAAGHGAYGGADLGEVLVTVRALFRVRSLHAVVYGATS